MSSEIRVNTIAHSGGTSAITTNSDGTTSFSVDKRERIITGSAQAMSGTENTITGIPATAHCIRLYIDGTYKNGSTQSRFRVGAGSISTSGYDWRVIANSSGGSVYSEGSTAGCDTYMDGASGSGYSVWGFYEIRKLLSTSNRYLITSRCYSNNTYYHNNGSGHITLGGALDRVQWTTVAGNATFQGGSIFLEYSIT